MPTTSTAISSNCSLGRSTGRTATASSAANRASPNSSLTKPSSSIEVPSDATR